MMKLIVFLIFLISVSNQTNVKVIQSAKDTGDRLTQKSDISFQSDDRINGPLIIEIDTKTTYQKILGFGGAFTEAAAFTYSQLNPVIQKMILGAYFGPNGLNYSLCRVHINSCDFSLGSYNFDNITDDFNITHFDISHDKKWLIPFIKDALSASSYPINIYATPWSPPAWMKGNNAMIGTSVPGLKADEKYHSAWALYLSKWISTYKSEGIPIWGMTVQNEPEAIVPWESCFFSAENERDFIKGFLGPQMVKDHPDLTIMIYDHNKDHVYEWAKTIYSDPEASKYVHGMGFHWYTGSQFENVEMAHEVDPNKFLLATESCNCPGVLLDDWSRGESYGYDIIGDLNVHTVGWVDWNLLLDQQGGPNHLNNFCDACLIGDTVTQTLHFQPTYFYMGQISKYISPGSVRVKSSSPSNLSTIAVVTPNNEVVVVVMNQQDSAVAIQLQDSGKSASYTMPPHSITTFIYPKMK